MAPGVLISEVGPRDGLQNTTQVMPTAAKIAWIAALADAGLREIEVASFVPARLIPQMADAAEVVRQALTIPGLTVGVLVPNAKGAQRAMTAGAHKITLPISVSRSHSLANLRMTPDQAVGELRQVCRLRDGLSARRPVIEAGLSTAFGCSIEGRVSEDEVERLALACVEAGSDEVGLADTAGYANPAQVVRLVRRIRGAVGGSKFAGLHLHNTMGLGLANALAAFEEGVTTFDSSQAGLGGCPFAPGASGNIVTEDLVFMFESMGVPTGVDLARLLRARDLLAAGLPGEPLYGHVPAAGLPRGFVPGVR